MRAKVMQKNRQWLTSSCRLRKSTLFGIGVEQTRMTTQGASKGPVPPQRPQFASIAGRPGLRNSSWTHMLHVTSSLSNGECSRDWSDPWIRRDSLNSNDEVKSTQAPQTANDLFQTFPRLSTGTISTSHIYELLKPIPSITGSQC